MQTDKRFRGLALNSLIDSGKVVKVCRTAYYRRYNYTDIYGNYIPYYYANSSYSSNSADGIEPVERIAQASTKNSSEASDYYYTS
jgi:hypothetical protein